MNEKAQLWIGLSNREESMARVLSRGGLDDGVVLHAQRAVYAALTALFVNSGWPTTSGKCVGLCEMLESRGIVPPAEVRKAAAMLDVEAAKRSLSNAGELPEPASADAAVACLDAIGCVRKFVNPALSK